MKTRSTVHPRSMLVRIVATSLVAAAMGTPTSLAAEAASFTPAMASEWLTLDLPQVVRRVVGPQGAQIFPTWEREGDEVTFAAVFFAMPATMDIGETVVGRLGFSFDPTTLQVSWIEFQPQNPIRREALAGALETDLEIHYCKDVESDSVLEAELEPTSNAEEATYSFGLLASSRLVVVLSPDLDEVTSLRWVGLMHGLEGCL